MGVGSIADCFRAVLASEPEASARRVAKHCQVYASGSQDQNIYYLAAGQLKLTMLWPSGRECLLSVHTAGDVFGESCLAGSQRQETATAMCDCVVQRLPGSCFLAAVSRKGLTQTFVKYLADQLTEQRQIITQMATVDCEYRLGDVLLRLSRKFRWGGAGAFPYRISHQELAQMVGTTRPRISELMRRLRLLGVIETTPDARIVVHQQKLQVYLDVRESSAPPHVSAIEKQNAVQY